MTGTEKNKPIKPINIREIFREKNERIARFTPGFVYSYLHRILHIDFINNLLKKHGQQTGIAFVDKVVEEFNVREHLHGLENIPSEGKFIFASNHPLGGFDGMLLMKNVEKKLGSFKFLSNDILLNIPQLSPVFVPVNKHGRHAREAAKMLSGVYDSDVQVLIFPSGLASRKIKGQIMDLEWKKHFISKAIEHKRDIIPVFISGRNTNRFYRLAKLRKFLGIKWNLEMFFLPDETYRHRNTDVHLYFGKPIPYTTFNSTKNHKEWAEWVKQEVYKLPTSYSAIN
ncbi:1-acyl-sn-glycerol-3-phosphate acyltransferase [Maribellus sp. YY47]|uniref:1-acyl-sn-glycerol-3-phosphate acyltransferase n=1 Tax=Maribellus sp. YY47 TaxID=2929486 RepID=UPI002001B6E2|nr:1-acyl-sn-glycerol-3-phosphate acyltransferase [Maribellus sp. YY47]MCK3685891.1 1-acyl-sn-glycerol-3-phosphate acyltransferase [Maribellus sp. YY47]